MSPAAIRGTPSSTAGRRPFRFFHVQVAAVRDLTPHMRRVTFTGPDLGDFADPGWDQRIKLVLPAPASGYEHLPTGEDWYSEWRALPQEHRPPIRTYTTRAVRPGAGAGRAEVNAEVDVDMVVHAAPPTLAGRQDSTVPSTQPGSASQDSTGWQAAVGPAARWVASAAVGSEVVLLGPDRGWAGEPGGVGFVPPPVTERFLLGGDETAAPAIARILEDLPTTARGVAVVELPTEADTAYLPTHPGIEVRAAGREGRPHGRALVEGVRAAAAELCPAGRSRRVEEVAVDTGLLWEVPRTARGGAALQRTTLYAWLAGEATAVRATRRHLVSDLGIDRRTVAFMGYWRQGRPEG
nr:siderophore-interacting protein [Actinomyces sp. 2119]